MGQIMDNGVSTDPLAGFGGRSRKGKKKEKKGEKKRKKKGGERKRVKQKIRLQPWNQSIHSRYHKKNWKKLV